jgi:hypothetical protein
MLHHHSQGDFIGIFNSPIQFRQITGQTIIQRELTAAHQFSNSQGNIELARAGYFE